MFNIVQPDLAVFGEKDFQQLFLIKKMVKDLDFPIKILAAGTVREDSGLAMSSRNHYLSATQRMRAALLYKCLQQTAASIVDGERNYLKLEENAAKILENYEFIVDYVSIMNAVDLQIAAKDDKELVILAAVRLGKARLIDNITVDLSGTIKPL